MSRMHPRVFPKQHPVSVMCPQQAGFVQPQHTDSTYCSNGGDCHCVLSYKHRFQVSLLNVVHILFGIIIPVFFQCYSKSRLGQDLFCWTILTRQLADKEWDSR